ncbi:unnamed protein product [Mycena citricolor]|uniref:Uncharacterized protein n=1 Tax=Mycena citricolor TaxID=2018698 RepID=A0AAD2HV55_9AGAR|nr:unnamed protein product [Mycena citricolor]CAK5282376.1 unnamed protein product [Mycena citricolor]
MHRQLRRDSCHPCEADATRRNLDASNQNVKHESGRLRDPSLEAAENWFGKFIRSGDWIHNAPTTARSFHLKTKRIDSFTASPSIKIHLRQRSSLLISSHYSLRPG